MSTKKNGPGSDRGTAAFLCDLCEPFAIFAVKILKAFNRKVRKALAKFAKNNTQLSVAFTSIG